MNSQMSIFPTKFAILKQHGDPCVAGLPPFCFKIQNRDFFPTSESASTETETACYSVAKGLYGNILAMSVILKQSCCVAKT